MTQFTSKGVKQINNWISFKHLYHSYLSAFFISAGVPNGEFPDTAFMRETPAKRGRVNRYAYDTDSTGLLYFMKIKLYISIEIEVKSREYLLSQDFTFFNIIKCS